MAACLHVFFPQQYDGKDAKQAVVEPLRKVSADESDKEGEGRHGAVAGLRVLLCQGLSEGVDDWVDVPLLEYGRRHQFTESMR